MAKKLLQWNYWLNRLSDGSELRRLFWSLDYKNWLIQLRGSVMVELGDVELEKLDWHIAREKRIESFREKHGWKYIDIH